MQTSGKGDEEWELKRKGMDPWRCQCFRCYEICLHTRTNQKKCEYHWLSSARDIKRSSSRPEVRTGAARDRRWRRCARLRRSQLRKSRHNRAFDPPCAASSATTPDLAQCVDAPENQISTEHSKCCQEPLFITTRTQFTAGKVVLMESKMIESLIC